MQDIAISALKVLSWGYIYIDYFLVSVTLAQLVMASSFLAALYSS